jgi:hypothetical protein
MGRTVYVAEGKWGKGMYQENLQFLKRCDLIQKSTLVKVPIFFLVREEIFRLRDLT